MVPVAEDFKKKHGLSRLEKRVQTTNRAGLPPAWLSEQVFRSILRSGGKFEVWPPGAFCPTQPLIQSEDYIDGGYHFYWHAVQERRAVHPLAHRIYCGSAPARGGRLMT